MTDCIVPCNYECNSCSFISPACITCGRNRNSPAGCSCKDKYYDEGSLKDCLLCVAGKYVDSSSNCLDCNNLKCATCSGSPNSCDLTCKSNCGD